MRDIALTAAFLLLWLPAFVRPWQGPLLWAWISMMSPHRLTWGFAYNFPFAMVAAATTLLVFLYTRERQPFPRQAPAVLMVVFFLWCCLTSLTSFNTPDVVFDMWLKVFKIQIMLFVTMMLLAGRQQINWLIWVIVLSVGFYGFKGGIFILLTGGENRVWGPTGSFIENNNCLAVALVMLIPLIYYLYGIETRKWMRRGLLLFMALNLVSILGTYSRGAVVAVAAMSLFLGFKSRHKVFTLAVLVAVLAGSIAFLPDKWTERMNSISTYQDDSAQSRIRTWLMLWNLAKHHPVVGGGYSVSENPKTWETYAVTPWTKAFAAHSNYFQALSEHGFIGLFLYLLLGVCTWRSASRTAHLARAGPAAEWVPQLMRMIQASLVGFAVGGLFANLVNYDLPYYLAAIVAMVGRDVRRGLATCEAENPAPTPVAPIPAPALKG